MIDCVTLKLHLPYIDTLPWIDRDPALYFLKSARMIRLFGQILSLRLDKWSFASFGGQLNENAQTESSWVSQLLGEGLVLSSG
jgi:hypothetical protein